MRPRYGATPEEWQHFAKLGLVPDLLPVVSNPAAQISTSSTIKRLGKTPSSYNPQGRVIGFSAWTQHTSTPENVGAWALNPDYGVCIQTRRVRALDIDIAAAEPSDRAAAIVGRYAMLPERSRANSAKRLFIFALAGEYSKRVVSTPDGAIEFLAGGQQFVAAGTHESGARYVWLPSLPDSIPELSSEQFERLWSELSQLGEARTSKPSRPVDLLSNDPIAQRLQALNLIQSTNRDGTLHISCPFAEEHTSESATSATSYFPAHTGGFAQGNFKCLHAHCAGRSRSDFLTAIGIEAAPMFDDLASVASKPLQAVGVGAFLRELRDQHYVWENVLALNNLYALTARWGHGKTALMLTVALHVAAGRPLCGMGVEANKILYLCGENPDDVRLRVTAGLRRFGMAIEDIEGRVFFTQRPFAIDDRAALAHFIEANRPLGPFGLMVIDTGPAHSGAEDENSNREAHAFAMAIRDLMAPLGSPATVLLMHPPKTSTRDTLEPRGGSAMAGSIDGELCAWQEERDSPVEFFHRAKLRGPGFSPMFFDLDHVQVEGMKTNFGKPVTTIVAVPTDRRPEKKAESGRMTGRQNAILAIYHGLSGTAESAVEMEAILDAAHKKWPAERRSNLRQAVRNMAEKGLLSLAMDALDAEKNTLE